MECVHTSGAPTCKEKVNFKMALKWHEMDTHSAVNEWFLCSAIFSICGRICTYKYTVLSGDYSSFRDFPHVIVIQIRTVFETRLINIQTEFKDIFLISTNISSPFRDRG
jgi:hypothetical protein